MGRGNLRDMPGPTPRELGGRKENTVGIIENKIQSVQVDDVTPVKLGDLVRRTKIHIQVPRDAPVSSSIFLGHDNTVSGTYGLATRGIELLRGQNYVMEIAEDLEVWAIAASGFTVWVTISEVR